MEFRPCIDIHNGCVKQIVGGSLQDAGDQARENFVSRQDAAYYAGLYAGGGIKGGHVILLNAPDSPFYAKTKELALEALRAYPGGMQAGGGITPENAEEFLDAGASHVIVTSYVFREGLIHMDRLKELMRTVGKQHLVLDVSCKKTDRGYMVVTDRWQRLTKQELTLKLLSQLSQYCDEFLIHAVDVEGKAEGIEKELTARLGAFEGPALTYAGGVHSYQDIELVKELGRDRVNVTVGSALDLFGGTLEWKKVLEICRKI